MGFNNEADYSHKLKNRAKFLKKVQAKSLKAQSSNKKNDWQ